MRYTTLGVNGPTVSVVGLGCNQFGGRLDLDGTRAVLDAAIDAGVTLLDTAESYGGGGGSETLMGEALRGRRDKVVLATKFGHAKAPQYDVGSTGSPAYVRRAVEESLRRLQTDWIDVYQMHTPDDAVPIEETLGALHTLVDEGKIRYLGHSNFSGKQIDHAAEVAAAQGISAFVSAQNAYNWLDRSVEAEVVPACERHGLGLLPYYPLALGMLTGKVGRDGTAPAGSRISGRPEAVTEAKLEKTERLRTWADAHGRSLLEVAVSGLAAMPAVASVIAGATSPEQVRANVAAGQWEPTADELAELTALTA
jgi:aryl-alcohol dehydrogenase-like predicted oxidoreductase